MRRLHTASDLGGDVGQGCAFGQACRAVEVRREILVAEVEPLRGCAGTGWANVDVATEGLHGAP